MKPKLVILFGLLIIALVNCSSSPSDDDSTDNKLTVKASIKSSCAADLSGFVFATKEGEADNYGYDDAIKSDVDGKITETFTIYSGDSLFVKVFYRGDAAVLVNDSSLVPKEYVIVVDGADEDSLYVFEYTKCPTGSISN